MKVCTVVGKGGGMPAMWPRASSCEERGEALREKMCIDSTWDAKKQHVQNLRSVPVFPARVSRKRHYTLTRCTWEGTPVTPLVAKGLPRGYKRRYHAGELARRCLPTGNTAGHCFVSRSAMQTRWSGREQTRCSTPFHASCVFFSFFFLFVSVRQRPFNASSAV